MFKNIINRLFRRRHYWRNVGFDELSELYVSMMFRSLALSLAGIFVPIYLIQLHYSLAEVLGFYGVFFAARTMWDFAAGYLTARIGPKHTMLASYMLQVIALTMLITLKDAHWPLAAIAVVSGGSMSLFYVAFHVDFSKVKHSVHGGKEVSFMNIVERAGATVGPFAGGLIAGLFGARYTFLLAMLLFIVGLLPLFLSGEPVRTRQQLDFRGLPVHRLKRDLLSWAAMGTENNLTMTLWPLFMALFIFGDNPYAKIGLLSSVAVLMSIMAARMVGRLIDNHRGRVLLRYGATGNAALHLARPFIGTFGGVLGVNVVNELVTVAYRIPYTKGMYDAADQLPGHRIVYIVSMEALGDMAKATVFWLLAIAATVMNERMVLNSGFVIAAAASCLIMGERFAALQAKRREKP